MKQTKEIETTTTYVCPVCKKPCELTENNQFFIGEGPTCSWKCFMQYCREHPQPIKHPDRVKRRMFEVKPTVNEYQGYDFSKERAERDKEISKLLAKIEEFKKNDTKSNTVAKKAVIEKSETKSKSTNMKKSELF